MLFGEKVENEGEAVVFLFGEKVENEGKAVMVLLPDNVAVGICLVPVSVTPSETVAVFETFLEVILESSTGVLDGELVLPVSSSVKPLVTNVDVGEVRFRGLEFESMLLMSPVVELSLVDAKVGEWMPGVIDVELVLVTSLLMETSLVGVDMGESV